MTKSSSRVAARLGDDWIRPHWMERQLDPRSPAFVPSGDLPAVANLTARNWTAIGTVGSMFKGIVDPRGLVTPRSDGWSLDWWILGEDRWHFPSRESAVRQQLVDATPVVETSMRIKGGDAVQRVYAVTAPEPMAVMEITNRAPTPIAVALSIRPYNPVGIVAVERIELHDRTVIVDDRPALLLPKRPQGAAASTSRNGDVVRHVLAEETADEFPNGARCDDGLATAAFVFSLAHTASLRIGMPLDGGEPIPRRSYPRRSAKARPVLPEVVPTSDAVARGWQAQTSGRGLRLVLPEGTAATAIEANRRHLLLNHEGTDVVPGPFTSHSFNFRDAASLLGALDRFGFHAESAEVIRHLPARQRADGHFSSQRESWGSTGQALHAMAEHWRLTGSVDELDALAVANGARWIERKRRSRAGASSEDDFWSLRGLLDAADLLGALEDERGAVECQRWADGLRADLEASMAHVADRIGSQVLPAGPTCEIDSDIIATLVACVPLGLLAPDHPVIAAILGAVRERFTVGPACFRGVGHTGLAPSLTMQLAAVELAAGDLRALDRFAWMLEAASETFTWPELIHPNLGSGCAGEGHSGRAAADFLSFARDLLVRESGPNELALATMLPPSWRGQNLEVHDAPTHFGDVSFAVRWHDDRPALLWHRKAREGTPPVRITAPGLDPSWATDLPRGESLLATAPGVRIRDEVLSGTISPIEGSFS